MKRPWTRLALFAATLLVAPGLSAQKKPLDHDAYDVWNRIQGQTLTADGNWVAYRIVPGDGDATLVARDLREGTEVMLPRGQNHRFTEDGRWLIYRIAPHQAATDQAKLDKKRPNQMPQDSLGILDLRNPTRAPAKVANVTGFSLPEENSEWVAYMLHESERPEPAEEEEEPAEEEEAEGEEDEEERDKDEGNPLVLRSLMNGREHRFEDVTDHAFAKSGDRLFYAASNEDGSADGVYRVDVSSGNATTVLSGEGAYTQMALDEDGERVAFLTNRDDWDADEPDFTLYVDDTALATAGTRGLIDGWWVNQHGNVRFSENGERVFFGTQPRPAPEPDMDDVLPEDVVELDVWNWQDPYIMPMQLVQRRQEERRAYLAVADLDGGAVRQLATLEVPQVDLGDDGNSRWALGTTDVPYRQQLSWDGRYSDAFLIDVVTGESRRIAEAVRGFGRPRFSPEANYVYWWEPFEMAWYVADVDTGNPVKVSEAIPEEVHDLFDDRPEPPNPAGQALWTEGDEHLLIYDWHDIWMVDPTGASAPRNVTERMGREGNLRFRVASMSVDEGQVPEDEDIVLTAFDLDTKAEGFYRDRLDGSSQPMRLAMDDVNFGNPQKADDADVVLLTRETFEEFGDLHVTDSRFANLDRISDANPQQDEYLWGTSELVEWTSNDGTPLQGILYKPENFDPNAEYPMMVYFYERSSQGLNGYHVPAAGSSSINRSFYVSRGYVVFVPDIPYEEGHPGESAIDAVVPGVLSVLDQGFVNPQKIGVQGHSWGGYQISHMITRTNIFAAAEAGAPVVNMTSAYGGIRWASGMVRQFQYEQTQSRIGGSLWDKPLEYLDNSPLFQADKIETPLLMMHNDEDGAVPWYQGIEMFAAMRRLQKPVWMLNYNGEAHGLREEANRRDWAVRMQQFFDHYLMDEDPPVWMVDGIPAVMKGKTWGLDLVRRKPITE